MEGVVLEKTLIEFKAKIRDIEESKTKLLNIINAEYIGEYRQLDTYFKVPQGRLKIRQLAGVDSSHLIYYERETMKGPKESKVWISKVIDPEPLKSLLQKLFPISSMVNKHREIYICNNMQIHLDEVENLGSYIEFEMEIQNESKAKKIGYNSLNEVMKILSIKDDDLEEASYGELLTNI